MLVPYEKFTLDESFISKYKGTQPGWGPLGYLVFKRTYAADKADGTTEEFWETCQRVVEGVYKIQKGHCKRHNLPWSDRKAQRSAQEMFERMYAFKWLPPGRGLSKMGTEILYKIGGGCLNNCGFISTKDIGNTNIEHAFAAPFVWLMNMSMVGVGVGFDTLGARKVKIIKPVQTAKFVVEDSREGWCNYLQQLLQSFVDFRVPFPEGDFSNVRPKGAVIKGFGGTASGPESLVLMTDRVLALTSLYIDKEVDSRFIVDLANSIGECVVAGGVRRTAEIAFGQPGDSVFLNLKNYAENPEASQWPRWASNNSLVVDNNTDFTDMAELIAQNGEPGCLFLENARAYGRMKDPANYKDHRAMGANPCVEQTLENYELCCLVETFPVKCDSYEDYQRTLKYAYLYAKTVTLITTQSAATNAVMLRNRRIGCSQSGIQDNIEKIGLRQHLNWCDEGYQYIQTLDAIYSDWLCIPRSIKTTSVKPSGTVSKLVGLREGIHESKGEYEYQTIRINDTSPLLKPLEEAGYRIEVDTYARNTMVVYFPMHYKRSRRRDPSMWEQFELAALMQYYWADNQVSVTIDFDKVTEGPEIARALSMYAHRLKGLSLLPRSEHGYVQAPKTVISKEEYEAYRDSLKPVDFSQLQETREFEDKFCDGGLCEVPAREAS
jgi:hypothetical protein